MDPFLGLGSAAVAAARLDIDFIGVEIDGDYLAEGIRRVNAELNERGLFESRQRRRRPQARRTPADRQP
jgi:DNA modification methylase